MSFCKRRRHGSNSVATLLPVLESPGLSTSMGSNWNGLAVSRPEIGRIGGGDLPPFVKRPPIETIPPQYSHEDVEGRLCDVLWMTSLSARKAKSGCSRIVFEVILHLKGTNKQHQTLVLDIGLGDTPESVITMAFPRIFEVLVIDRGRGSGKRPGRSAAAPSP